MREENSPISSHTRQPSNTEHHSSLLQSLINDITFIGKKYYIIVHGRVQFKRDWESIQLPKQPPPPKKQNNFEGNYWLSFYLSLLKGLLSLDRSYY